MPISRPVLLASRQAEVVTDGDSYWPKGFLDELTDELTAVFEELPGANTQGATLEEARANLQEAVAMVIEANRDLIGETTAPTTPSS